VVHSNETRHGWPHWHEGTPAVPRCVFRHTASSCLARPIPGSHSAAVGTERPSPTTAATSGVARGDEPHHSVCQEAPSTRGPHHDQPPLTAPPPLVGALPPVPARGRPGACATGEERPRAPPDRRTSRPGQRPRTPWSVVVGAPHAITSRNRMTPVMEGAWMILAARRRARSSGLVTGPSGVGTHITPIPATASR